VYEGFNLVPSLFYSNSESKNNDTGDKTQETNLFISTRLGVTLKGGLYIGAIYDLETTDDGTDKLETSNMSLSLGFTENGSYIVLHYFMDTSREISSTTTYTGKGKGVDFGHHFKIGNTFSLGAQISFRTIQFDTSDVSGAESNIDIETERAIPMLTFGFTF